MTYCFIINPGSHHKQGAKFIPVLLRTLEKRGIDFEYSLTSSLQDACELSAAANAKGFDVIVAIGGDGTINHVVNGFYDQNGKRISSARLGVIHTGTSPDFCRSYGIPTFPALALETLLRGYTKEISVARIEYHSQTGASKTGYFTCCANFGLGAQVARRSNAGIRKYMGDALGTFGSILISLSHHKPSDLKIICDGKDDIIVSNFNTFIGKTTYIASGMKVEHSLSDTDNRLYLLSLKSLNARNLVPALTAIYSGKAIVNNDNISFSYAHSIEIPAGQINNEVEFDGDPQGYLPCRITIAPDKLEIIANEL